MRGFKKTVCMISGLLLISVGLFADDKAGDTKYPSSMSLTISDAVECALNENLSVKKGNLSLEQKKRQMDYVWGSLLPSIRATASMSKIFSDNDMPASLNVGGSVSLGLTPSIYTSVRSAQLNYDLQKMSYDLTLRTVELNVRKAFYGLLFEKENIDLIQNNVNTAQTQYNSNVTKYNHGTLSQLDVLSSQIALQNAQINLDVAKSNYESDLANFKQTLGIPQSVAVTLDGSLDDIMKIGTMDINNVDAVSTTVANYEKQLEIARNGLLATRFAAWGPSVSASYSYNATGNTDKGIESNNYGSLSLSVSIPLDGFLPWSSGGQSIENQKSNIESLEAELEDAKTSSAINTNNYLKKIKQIQDSIALRKKSITLAEQTYNMTAQAYSRGTRDLLSLQNSLSALQQARLNLKSDILNLASNILELENTLGLPFGTFTNTVNED